MRDNRTIVKLGVLLALLGVGVAGFLAFAVFSAETGTAAVAMAAEAVAVDGLATVWPVILIAVLTTVSVAVVVSQQRNTERKRKDEVSEEAYRYVEELIDQGVVRLVADDEELPESDEDDLNYGDSDQTG